MFPLHTLHGNARQRGRQHGELARDRIGGSIHTYAGLFALCGIGWTAAQQRAAAYRPLLEALSADIIDELDGIAEGSGFAPNEILALNCRSEILPNEVPARDDDAIALALASNADLGLVDQADYDYGECTSVAVSGERCADGHTRVAQNWDWIGLQRPNVIGLRVQRDDGPAYLTCSEAGMLAKIGVNEHGLGIGLNILRARNDGQTLGVPVHVFQRLALDCDSVDAVITLAQSLRFSASSNAILGDASGDVAALEYGPNGATALAPTAGVVCHSNHFCVPDFQSRQASLLRAPTSKPRLATALAISEGWPAYINDSHLQALLRAERGADGKAVGAICRQPDPRLPPLLRVETVFGIIIDCDQRRLAIASDLPSRSEFVNESLL